MDLGARRRLQGRHAQRPVREVARVEQVPPETSSKRDRRGPWGCDVTMACAQAGAGASEVSVKQEGRRADGRRRGLRRGSRRPRGRGRRRTGLPARPAPTPSLLRRLGGSLCRVRAAQLELGRSPVRRPRVSRHQSGGATRAGWQSIPSLSFAASLIIVYGSTRGTARPAASTAETPSMLPSASLTSRTKTSPMPQPGLVRPMRILAWSAVGLGRTVSSCTRPS